MGFATRMPSFRRLFLMTLVHFSLLQFTFAGEIDFFALPNFEVLQYQSHKIATSCQTLSIYYQRKIQSLKTKKCVEIFSDEECSGESKRLPAGEHADLGTFKYLTVSYRSCNGGNNDKPNSVQEFRIKFYMEENFKKLILDELIPPECTTLFEHEHFWNQTRSVVTPVCVILFSGKDCSGELSFSLFGPKNHSTLGSFNDRLISFKPCNPNDVRQINVSAKILSIEVTSAADNNDGRRSYSQKIYSELNQLHQTTETFKNDQPDPQFQEYIAAAAALKSAATPTEIHDKLQINLGLSTSQVHQIDLSTFLPIEFSSSFNQSLKLAFLNRPLNDGGEGFQKLFRISSPFSESTSTSQFHNETEAFQLEENNLKQMVAQTLEEIFLNSSGHNQDSFNYTSPPKEIRFSILKDLIRVPNCSKLEVRTVMKMTRSFPAVFYIQAEISAKFEKTGEGLPATEIMKRWKHLSYINGTSKDPFKVIARQKGTFLLDYHWYAAWIGKETPLKENCVRKKVQIVSIPNQRNNHGEDDGGGGGVWTWIYVLLGLAAAALIAIPLFVILYRVHRHLTNIAKVLTKEDVKEFHNGMSDQTAAQILPGVKVDQDCPLKLPYDRTLEIPKERLTIKQDCLLGYGQFAVVLKARIEGIGEVALKMVKHNCPSTALLGLLSEIKILSFLGRNLKHIVSIEGAYTKEMENGIIYLATELCVLGSLDKYLRNGMVSGFQPPVPNNNGNRLTEMSVRYISLIEKEPTEEGEEGKGAPLPRKNEITFNDMLRWSSEIASGMEYLMEKKVIHADLATRNVLLTSDKTAKITDFGLSRKLYDYTDYVKKQQEPLPWRWMAVESLKKMEFSSRSDVWSYGVTLWEIFSLGSQPYPGLSWSLDFVDRLSSGLRLNCPTYATPEVYKIMERCWMLEPNSRPAFTQIKEEMGRMSQEYSKDIPGNPHYYHKL